MLTLDVMQRMWPHGNQKVPGLLEGIVATAPDVIAKYKISPLALALMMAQFSHECGAGLEMVENLNYSAQGLLKTWPRHYTAQMAIKYAHNPQAIGNISYGGRMGNDSPPSNDGYNYRGRGFSQLTGKEAYHRLAKACGVDVLTHPEYLSDPRFALLCGVSDFVDLCGCLPFAERGDVLNTTKHLNGGTIGLVQRIRWTAQWREELKV